MFNLCSVQNLCRRYLDLRSFQYLLLEQSKASSAITIQSLWRSYCTKLIYMSNLGNINMDEASALPRRIAGPKNCGSSEWKKWESKILWNKAVIIQAAWRSFFCSEQYFSFMFNLVVFQGLCRRFIVQREFESLLLASVEQFQALCATAVQRLWRSYDTKLAYSSILCDIVAIQALVRRKIARLKSSFSTKIHIIDFQSGDSAITIQTAWRSFACLEQYLRFMLNIVILQNLCRRYISMCTFKSMVLKEADKTAVIIQRRFRSYTCRDSFFQTLADVIILQRFVQWWLRQRKVQIFHHVRDLRESGVKEYSSSLIQRTWRSHVASIRYLYFRNFVLLAQRTTRRHLARIKAGKAALLHVKESALVIQRSWRSRVCSLLYFEKLVCVCIIQSFVRQKIQFMKLNRIRRMRGLRESESQYHFACTLQRFIRPHFATKRFRNVFGSAITIQSFVRRHITKTRHSRNSYSLVVLGRIPRRPHVRYSQRKIIYTIKVRV